MFSPNQIKRPNYYYSAYLLNSFQLADISVIDRLGSSSSESYQLYSRSSPHTGNCAGLNEPKIKCIIKACIYIIPICSSLLFCTHFEILINEDISNSILYPFQMILVSCHGPLL